MSSEYFIGIDVGSTTVKMVVVETCSQQIVWSQYLRHETRQPETVLRMLEDIQAALPYSHTNFRVFITGSGAAPIAPHIGAGFVQEVNAVTMAVEELHPDRKSVV